MWNVLLLYINKNIYLKKKKEETIKSLPFKDQIRLNLKLKMHMNKEFLKETFVDLEVKE